MATYSAILFVVSRLFDVVVEYKKIFHIVLVGALFNLIPVVGWFISCVISYAMFMEEGKCKFGKALLIVVISNLQVYMILMFIGFSIK